MSTVVEVLRLSRELYASAPSHAAYMTSPERGTYCVLMAIHRAAFDLEVSAHVLLIVDHMLRGTAGTAYLVPWNAENSTEVVLEAWDRAIAAAEAKA